MKKENKFAFELKSIIFEISFIQFYYYYYGSLPVKDGCLFAL